MSAAVAAAPPPDVVRVSDLDVAIFAALVRAFGARLVLVENGVSIPGSYWGDSEAGLVGDCVYVRGDTPVHSLLHEVCHYVCMDAARRAVLVTDAFGDDDEECAVCFLQVVLAAEIDGFDRARCLADMDAWGYSFREGSARAWLAGDAAFAREWLLSRGLIDSEDRPTFRLRSG